ncbi:hypothetical protein [Aphanothece sacrum]|nr:hypothetical protein [Aphanothece sacrum]
MYLINCIVRSRILSVGLRYETQHRIYLSIKIVSYIGIISRNNLNYMAQISNEILITILTIYRQLLELINEAKATESQILEQFGETEITLIVLEELQNIVERMRNSYSRLNTLLLRIAEAQPIADAATLELLIKSIEQAQGNLASSLATIQESKRDTGLL